MTNKELQQELLEKVKEGVKPSDLKKPRRIIKPKDDGYSSSEDKSIPQAPPLPNSQIKDLQSQLQALQADLSAVKSFNKGLQKQLQLYKDFREGDLKIKEGYKETIAELQAKNSELTKTIQNLQNQAKTTVDKEPIENPEAKTFTCSNCNQAKPQDQLSRVFGQLYFCLACSKKARQTAQQEKTTPKPQTFTCVACEQEKLEIPHYKKVDISYKPQLIKGQEYPVCSSCSTYVKEYNEHEDYEFSAGED